MANLQISTVKNHEKWGTWDWSNRPHLKYLLNDEEYHRIVEICLKYGMPRKRPICKRFAITFPKVRKVTRTIQHKIFHDVNQGEQVHRPSKPLSSSCVVGNKMEKLLHQRYIKKEKRIKSAVEIAHSLDHRRCSNNLEHWSVARQKEKCGTTRMKVKTLSPNVIKVSSRQRNLQPCGGGDWPFCRFFLWFRL